MSARLRSVQSMISRRILCSSRPSFQFVRWRNTGIDIASRGLQHGVDLKSSQSFHASLDLSDKKPKLAILIDGDNAESSLLSKYIATASKFGSVTVRRIYADWTSPYMSCWKNSISPHAIRPIQKFAYTKGKNSTDTALIIDAMDLLHSKLVDGFCIVSSDSDFTGLAYRIREEGLFVMGIGRTQTPEAFVSACEIFTFSETLRSRQDKIKQLDIDIDTVVEQTHKDIDMDLIDRAYQNAYDEDKRMAYLSLFQSKLIAQDPTFNMQQYGVDSLRSFCRTLLFPRYELVYNASRNAWYIKKCNDNQSVVSQQQSDLPATATTDPELTPGQPNSEEDPSPDIVVPIDNNGLDMNIIDQAYDQAYNKDLGMASVDRFRDQLVAQDASFSIQKYGASSFADFCKERLAPQYKLVEDTSNPVAFIKKCQDHEPLTAVSDESVDDQQRDNPTPAAIDPTSTLTTLAEPESQQQLMDATASHNLVNEAFTLAVDPETQTVALDDLERLVCAQDATFSYTKLGYQTFEEFCNVALKDRYEIVTYDGERSLRRALTGSQHQHDTIGEVPQPPTIKPTVDMAMIHRAYQRSYNNELGMARMSRMASELRGEGSAFNHKNYGYQTFTAFCRQELAPYYDLVIVGEIGFIKAANTASQK